MVQKSLLVIIVLVFLVACGGGAPAATTTPAPSATNEPTFTALPPTAPSTPTKAANTQGTNTSPTARNSATASATATSTPDPLEMADVNKGLSEVTVLPINASSADINKLVTTETILDNGDAFAKALQLAGMGQDPDWDSIPLPSSGGIVRGTYKNISSTGDKKFLTFKDLKLALDSLNKWLSDNKASVFIYGHSKKYPNTIIVLGLDLLKSDGTVRPYSCGNVEIDTDWVSGTPFHFVIVSGASMREMSSWESLSTGKFLKNNIQVLVDPMGSELTPWTETVKNIINEVYKINCYMPTDHPAPVK
jgi:hypothetical protein